MQLVQTSPASLPVLLPQLTVDMGQVARLLSVSRAGLDKLKLEPGFPKRFKIGKRDHVLYRELEAWVLSRYSAAA
jgi:predicted DNA-binding transcriptional regulator AlpA